GGRCRLRLRGGARALALLARRHRLAVDLVARGGLLRGLRAQRLVDLLRDLGVVDQELARLLHALPEADLAFLRVLHREPRARLQDDAFDLAELEQLALAADPAVEQDVE